MSIEAMKSWLAALERVDSNPNGLWNVKAEITSLRAAIEAASKAEPVAWSIYVSGEPADVFMNKQKAELEFDRRSKLYPDPTRKTVPLYTAAPSPAAVEDRKDAWQPIEAAPKDGTDILMFRKGIISTARFDGKDWGGHGWHYPSWDLPTHWMPLPNPPAIDAAMRAASEKGEAA